MRWKIGLVVLLLAGVGLLVIGSNYGTSSTSSTPELSGDGCLVLVYHRVLPRPFIIEAYLTGQNDYTIYQDSFEQQMKTLKASGIRFVRPQELESVIKRKAPLPHRCVLVTFDDADKSQYSYAFPIIKRENIPALLFVISGQVGAPQFNGMEMATWPQIREMVRSGLVTLGSHTHDLHRAAGAPSQPVFAGIENPAAFSADLELSMRTIHLETAETPIFFAYPFGFGSPETDEAALRLGMHLLFSLRQGVVRAGDPAFFVKRFMVTPRNWQVVQRWLEDDSTQRS